jgi:hypothetical protein
MAHGPAETGGTMRLIVRRLHLQGFEKADDAGDFADRQLDRAFVAGLQLDAEFDLATVFDHDASVDMFEPA